MKKTTAHEKLLVVLLRVSGVVVLLALAAVFLPVAWMAAIHAWLGLGDFPESPLVDYLTRSISALYAIHGGLLLLVSCDVRRYAAVVVYLAVTAIGFGLLMIGIDLHAGMPLRWTIGEGPPVLVLGIVILYLLRKASRAWVEDGAEP
jgi:hypothetical protein